MRYWLIKRACLPPPPASAYRLIDELRESAAVPRVHRVETDDLELEQALLSKLGARGCGRIHHFRNHYNAPWGERNAAPLSPRALDSLTHFVHAAVFPADRVPSVFLTDRGGLELCWEDHHGTPRQVEFTSEGAEYYVAATGEEGAVAPEAVAELARKLAS